MESVPSQQDSKPRFLGMGDWELNLLIVESILFSGLVMAGAWALMDKIWHLPRAVSGAIAFFLGTWVSYPALSVFTHSKTNHHLSPRSQFFLSTLVALFGGIFFWLASTYWH